MFFVFVYVHGKFQTQCELKTTQTQLTYKNKNFIYRASIIDEVLCGLIEVFH